MLAVGSDTSVEGQRFAIESILGEGGVATVFGVRSVAWACAGDEEGARGGGAGSERAGGGEK